MADPNDQPSELSVKISRGQRGFLPNIAMGLKSPSVALVLVAWLAAIVIVCIWGSERLAPAALGILAFFGAAYVVALGRG